MVHGTLVTHLGRPAALGARRGPASDRLRYEPDGDREGPGRYPEGLGLLPRHLVQHGGTHHGARENRDPLVTIRHCSSPPLHIALDHGTRPWRKPAQSVLHVGQLGTCGILGHLRNAKGPGPVVGALVVRARSRWDQERWSRPLPGRLRCRLCDGATGLGEPLLDCGPLGQQVRRPVEEPGDECGGDLLGGHADRLGGVLEVV